MGKRKRLQIEFQFIDENGDKWNAYFNSKHTRNSKIKAEIEHLYNVDLSKCSSFSMKKSYRSN